jgi:hypothetical protein
MKKAFLIGGGIFAAMALVGVAAVVGLLLLAGVGDRYTVTQRGNVTLRTDRFTGKTEMLTRDIAGKVAWTPVAEETPETKAATAASLRDYARERLEADRREAEAQKAACEEERRKYARYGDEYKKRYGFYPPPTMPNPYSRCE